MSKRDDYVFRPRSGKSPSARRDGSFISQVLKAAGPGVARSLGRARRRGPGIRGRGHVAFAMGRHRPGPKSRRVIVKARLVVLQGRLRASTRRHIRYLQREELGRPTEDCRAYGAETELADTSAFEERCQGDRHQFRFIVSAEDGIALGDLREFTRTLMQRVATDLGTELEWIAVDHHDTDNPHTHVMLRGRTKRGDDLVISREYISQGMRHRAQELATEWLGPRTERELQASRFREVQAERFTGLDRALLREVEGGVIDLRNLPEDRTARQQRSLALGRLGHLAKLGLAEQQQPGVWVLRADMEATLRQLGERGDIVRTVQRTLGAAGNDFTIFDPEHSRPVTGRVAAKGLADELHERGYLVLEGIDGRVHYVTLSAGSDFGGLPVGGIVAVRGVSGPRETDRTIAHQAISGTYRTQMHLARTHAEGLPGRDPESYVAAHTRRLEGLQRAGIVERLEEGVWGIPTDLPEQGQAYDRRHLGGAIVELRSHLPLERQTRALGATWLDRELLSGAQDVGTVGFGASVRQALTERTAFLVEQNLAERRATRLVLARNLLDTLRERELSTVGERLAGETGLSHRPLRDGQRVSGTYRRSVWLVSGRFAMLDDGQCFSLVPWRPVLERRLEQPMSAFVHGDRVTWELGRHRGLSR